MRALDAAKGTSLWHHPAGGRLSTAPIARAGWLVLALDTGEVRALRGESGEEVWKLALGAPVKSEPLIDGNRLYLSPENNRVVAVDLQSGKLLWDRDMGAIVNSVAAYKDGVYVGTTFAQHWQDRVVHGGLGPRSAASMTLSDKGILLDRDGAQPLFVPAADVVGVSRAARELAPVHVDAGAARRAGLPDVLLGTTGQAAWLWRAILEHGGPDAHLTRLDLEMHHPVTPGPLAIDVDAATADGLTLTIRSGDTACTTATAALRPAG